MRLLKPLRDAEETPGGAAAPARRPLGWFVHHQGRGHAERTLDLLRALPDDRPVDVFCARPALFEGAPAHVRVHGIPSLFEATGRETPMDHVPQPDTVHCAPIGWPGIREAMGAMAAWMREADPALIVCDVSAEVAQLARLMSVPHVVSLQHGDRSDPGHRSALDGAAGVLAPFHEAIAQPDWDERWLARTHFAPGLGLRPAMPTRGEARARIGVADREELVVVVSGAGGSGLPTAPLGVGARATPHARWIAIGKVAGDWHATTGGNLEFAEWVDNPEDYIAAADLVVASTGNTTCAMVMAAGVPWVAVPEWRYFDEQLCKARALDAAGLAHFVPHLPSSAHAWKAALAAARATHDPARQRACIRDDAAERAAAWLTGLADDLWRAAPSPAAPAVGAKPSTPLDLPAPTAGASPEPVDHRPRHTRPGGIPVGANPLPMTSPNTTFRADVSPAVSVLTIARGRDEHLANVVLGLCRQTLPPRELVVGVMQDSLYDLPTAPFPIRQIRVRVTGELPLAAARNAVANAARGEVLAFVDVDCIPAPTLVADYAREARSGEGVMMGEVLYLPDGATGGEWDYDAFDAVAEKHVDRAGPPEGARGLCDDYRCFWSLNFALHRDDWARSGGFDERYVGYGGEDTDFGKSLAADGIPIWWIRGARTYHQYHPHAMPPIQHVASVVRNAELFGEKWGHRTMEHWLYAFKEMGLIDEPDGRLRVIGAPRPEHEELCNQQRHMPYASTNRVLKILEERKSGREISQREANRRIRANRASMLGQRA